MPRMLTQISSNMGLTALGRFGRSYVQTDEVGLRTLPHLFSLPLLPEFRRVSQFGSVDPLVDLMPTFKGKGIVR